MPNEDIDVSDLERLKKYRSFDRYRRRAEQEARKPHWWRTYREHFGEESGAGRSWAVTPPSGDSGEGACPHSRPHWGGLVPPGFFTPSGPCIWRIPFRQNVRVPLRYFYS